MADDWKKESAPEHLEVIQANTIEIALKSAAVSTVEGKKSEIENRGKAAMSTSRGVRWSIRSCEQNRSDAHRWLSSGGETAAQTCRHRTAVPALNPEELKREKSSVAAEEWEARNRRVARHRRNVDIIWKEVDHPPSEESMDPAPVLRSRGARKDAAIQVSSSGVQTHVGVQTDLNTFLCQMCSAQADHRMLRVATVGVEAEAAEGHPASATHYGQDCIDLEPQCDFQSPEGAKLPLPERIFRMPASSFTTMRLINALNLDGVGTNTPNASALRRPPRHSDLLRPLGRERNALKLSSDWLTTRRKNASGSLPQEGHQYVDPPSSASAPPALAAEANSDDEDVASRDEQDKLYEEAVRGSAERVPLEDASSVQAEASESPRDHTCFP